MNLFCQRDSTDLDGCHNLYNPCHHVDEEQISEIGQALDGRRIHTCVVCVEEITLLISLDD